MTHAAPHILEIARCLLAQMHAFAVCVEHSDKDKEKLEESILPRLSLLPLLLDYLEVIDRQGTREALGRGTPVIYNTYDWPAGAPIGGWYDVDGEVPLKSHVLSSCASWHLQLSVEPAAMCGRVLRAALWVLDSTGSYEATLRYVLDLQQFGTVFKTAVTALVLETLLGVRRRVAEDSHIVGHCVTALRDQDWRFAELGNLDLASPVIRPDLRDDFDWLLQRAESEIDAVVDSPTYDDWFLGRLHLLSLLNVVQGLFRKYDLHETLPYVAAITTIEEIRADAGASARLLRLWGDRFMSFTFGANYTVSRVAVTALQGATADWLDRVIDERAAVPTRLQHLVTEDGLVESELPDGWRRFSAVSAPIVGPLLLGEETPELRRSVGFKPQDVETAATLAQLVKCAEASDRDILKQAAIELLCRELTPQTASSPEDNQQSSSPEDSEPSEALSVLNRFVTKIEAFDFKYSRVAGEYLPRQPLEILQQTTDNEENIESVLRELYTGACIDEIESLTGAIFAFGERDTEQSLPLLAKLTQLYPYLDTAWMEQAVRLDQGGDSGAAFDAMIQAITLQPWEYVRWHSLAIILRRLGAEREAAMAMMVSKAIEARGQPTAASTR